MAALCRSQRTSEQPRLVKRRRPDFCLESATFRSMHGFDVYIVDGYQLSNYRKGIGGRVKTDASGRCLGSN